jgi:hypothetical protein
MPFHCGQFLSKQSFRSLLGIRFSVLKRCVKALTQLSPPSFLKIVEDHLPSFWASQDEYPGLL